MASPEQSEKTRKYDRQLRLWGDHGQAVLEAAHVCVINATGLGTEILKSLVLPGVGAFTIVDDKKVTAEDIGCNFFIDASSLGKSRGLATSQLLLELNPDVRGCCVEEQVEGLLENTSHFFKNFTVVIATALKERSLSLLAKKLWEINVPLIFCRSYGFLGYIRIQVSEHTVIETHPENQKPDLRLDKPFSALKEHVDGLDFARMVFKEHIQFPYLIILYKCLQVWKETSDGALPRTKAEKQEFLSLIRKGLSFEVSGNVDVKENFEEPMKAVNTVVQPTAVPSDVQDILDDDACINLTSESKPFWIMVNAVRDFLANEGHGCLPLRGSLPDMTAETNQYIALQEVYKKQAAKEAEIVSRRVQELLRQLNQPPDTVTEEDVKHFCKNAGSIYVMRGSCIADEYEPETPVTESIAKKMDCPSNGMVPYIMLRGVDRFYTEYNAYPGETEDQLETDAVKLKACVSKLLTEWGCGHLLKEDFVHEVCRYGGGELHSLSSFVGGCAAQETIKLITHQYRPINNTFVYNGMTCESVTVKL